MEPLYLAGLTATVVLVTGLFIYLLGTRALRSKSYEEVIQEQRGRRDLLLPPGGEKKVRKKKEVGGKVRRRVGQHRTGGREEKVEEQPTGEEDGEAEVKDVDGGVTAVEEVVTAPEPPPLSRRRKKHVEISDRESSVEDPSAPPQHSPSHHCHSMGRRDSLTPILLNKSEASPVSMEEPEEDVNKFELTRPADDAELMKRRRSVNLVEPESQGGGPISVVEQITVGEQAKPPPKQKKKPPNPPQLIDLIKSTQLSPSETSNLIDLLLNKGDKADWQSSSSVNKEDLVNDLKERLREGEANINQLQGRIRELKQELLGERGKQLTWRGLVERVEKERDEWRGKATALHHTQSTNINLQAQLQQATNANQALLKEREALRSASTHLEKQLQLSFNSNQELSNKLKRVEDRKEEEMEKHKLDLEHLRRRLEGDFLEREGHVVEELKKKEEDFRRESHKCQELSSELQNWKKSVNELRLKVEESEGRNQNLEGALRKVEGVKMEVEGKLSIKEKELIDLEGRLSIKEKELIDLEGRLSIKDRELIDLEEKNRELLKSQASASLNGELQLIVKNLEAQLVEAREAVSTIEANKIEELQQQHSENVRELKSQMEALHAELLAREARISVVEKENELQREEARRKEEEFRGENERLVRRLEDAAEATRKEEPPIEEELRNQLKERDVELQNYKQILSETESLLKSLQSSVEEEETKWRERIRELEEEVDKLKAKTEAEGENGAAPLNIPLNNSPDSSPGKAKKKQGLGRLFKK